VVEAVVGPEMTDDLGMTGPIDTSTTPKYWRGLPRFEFSQFEKAEKMGKRAKKRTAGVGGVLARS